MARQGRGNATFQLLMIVGSLALLKVIAGATFKVGEGAGWTVPANGLNYNALAAQHTYHVGDVLEFTYNKDAHNVISLKTEEAFNSCDVNNADATLKVFEATGNTTITLAAPGMKYYACQKGAHCLSGQKFSIMVMEAPNSGGATSTAPASTASPPDATTGSSSSLTVHSTVGVALVLGATALLL